MAESKRGLSCLKWVGGIVAAVMTAVLVWWLTEPGGLLNPQDATQGPRPVLKIVNFQVSEAPVGGKARADITVFNEGDSTGEFCTVWWYSGSEVGRRLEQGQLPGEAAVSEEFGLRHRRADKSPCGAWSTVSRAVFARWPKCRAVARTSPRRSSWSMSR